MYERSEQVKGLNTGMSVGNINSVETKAIILRVMPQELSHCADFQGKDCELM